MHALTAVLEAEGTGRARCAGLRLRCPAPYLAICLVGSLTRRVCTVQGFTDRRQALLEFVQGINPSSEGPSIADDVPAPCLNAMRQTVTNLLGTLPPQFFQVTISTRSQNLAQLAYSVLMTGYMFSNAYSRLELTHSLGGLLNGAAVRPAEQLVGSASGSLDDAYIPAPPSSRLAAGSQKLRIEGEVLRWHLDDGVQALPALDYIEQLEQELEALRQKLEAQQAAPSAAAQQPAVSAPPLGGYDLLEYLKGLTSEQVAELTDCATPDVLEAMNSLVERLMGDEEPEVGSSGRGGAGGAGAAAWMDGRSECTAAELAQLLAWLMAVGHHLRAMEVRLGLRATLDSPATSDDDGDYGSSGGASSNSSAPRLPPPR